jgi:hypothetical protein
MEPPPSFPRPPVCTGCGEGEKKAEPLELNYFLRQLGRLPLYEDP